MDIKRLLRDERAVSPVIGVILMVAITVILAAVIGSFVLGLGNSVQQTAPSANFQFDYEETTGGDYNVTATHTGGQTLDSQNTASLYLNASDGSTETFGLPISAGGSANLTTDSGGNVTTGSTVRVIWTSADGATSQTLAEGQVP